MPNNFRYTNANNKFGAYFRLQCIQALTPWNPAVVGGVNALDQLFRGDGSGDVQTFVTPWSTVRPRTPQIPPSWGWVFDAQNNLSVFIGGLEDEYQLRLMLNGYAVGPPPANRNTISNRAILDWALYIYNYINVAFENINAMYFAGHSAGGAVAQRLFQNYLSGVNSTVRKKAIAFGAPCWINQDGHPFLPGESFTWQSCHWMKREDVVPFCPSSPSFWSWSVHPGGYRGQQRFAAFSQVCPGVVVAADGTTSPGVTPTESTGNEYNRIVEWLGDAESNRVTPHDLGSYLFTFAQMTASARQEPEAPTEYHSHRTTDSETMGDIVRRVEQTNQIILESNRERSAAVAIIPVVHRFVTVRQGRVYWVWFQDRALCAAPHRRGAHALCRIGNAWLRKLQLAATVDTDAIVDAFSSYLLLAQAGGSGFVPQLQGPLDQPVLP